MAEFMEVMRQGKRMCESISDCNDCPMMGDINTMWFCGRYQPEDHGEFTWDDETVEKITMKWAAEHPEPKLVYPTFAEWQKENFPDGADLIRPCLFSRRTADCVGNSCVMCAEQTRIPEDVALKLGIEPKEEKA